MKTLFFRPIQRSDVSRVVDHCAGQTATHAKIGTADRDRLAARRLYRFSALERGGLVMLSVVAVG
jgi:hypothetical protein